MHIKGKKKLFQQLFVYKFTKKLNERSTFFFYISYRVVYLLLHKLNGRHKINLYLKNGKCHICNKQHEGNLRHADPTPICDVINSTEAGLV